MTEDVRLAVLLLERCAVLCEQESQKHSYPNLVALGYLTHAIAHLSHPERDVYPKTRKGTKGRPIVRRTS